MAQRQVSTLFMLCSDVTWDGLITSPSCLKQQLRVVGGFQCQGKGSNTHVLRISIPLAIEAMGPAGFLKMYLQM